MCGYFGSRTFYFLGEDRMRIIALQGAENTGKTATLNQLIEDIKKTDGFVIEDIRLVNRNNPNNQDRVCWCTYNGIRIGITTRGDYRGCLHTDFYGIRRRNFKDRDIVVCAVRTRGGSIDFVNEQVTNPVIIRKRYAAEDRRAEVNILQSAEILKTIIAFSTELEA